MTSCILSDIGLEGTVKANDLMLMPSAPLSPTFWIIR